jgi:hypothetical protein
VDDKSNKKTLYKQTLTMRSIQETKMMIISKITKIIYTINLVVLYQYGYDNIF